MKKNRGEPQANPSGASSAAERTPQLEGRRAIFRATRKWRGTR